MHHQQFISTSSAHHQCITSASSAHHQCIISASQDQTRPHQTRSYQTRPSRGPNSKTCVLVRVAVSSIKCLLIGFSCPSPWMSQKAKIIQFQKSNEMWESGIQLNYTVSSYFFRSETLSGNSWVAPCVHCAIQQLRVLWTLESPKEPIEVHMRQHLCISQTLPAGSLCAPHVKI